MAKAEEASRVAPRITEEMDLSELFMIEFRQAVLRI